MLCRKLVALLTAFAVTGSDASLCRPGSSTSLTLETSTTQSTTMSTTLSTTPTTDFTTSTTETSSAPTTTTSSEPLCQPDPDFRKCSSPSLNLDALSDLTYVSDQGFIRSTALRIQLFQNLSLDECIQKCSEDAECVMIQSEPGQYGNTFKGRLADILPINSSTVGPRFYEKECFECACQ